MPRSSATNIDEYIAEFPADTQAVLAQMRELIRDVAPEATETISYAIPTFDMYGTHLVHFAGFAKHVSLFPTGSGVEPFIAELGAYKVSKGTVQFPLSEPLPVDLIRRMVQFRVDQVTAKQLAKKAGRKTAGGER